MNLSNIYADKIRWYAKNFQTGSLPKTAKWLNTFADEIEKGNSQQLSDLYDSAYIDFKNELCAGKLENEQLFDEIVKLLPGPKPKVHIPKTLDDLLNILDESSPSWTVIGHVLDVFTQSSVSIEEQFYGDCFCYLMLVEGVYDKALLFLYAWLENSEGRIANTRIEKTSEIKRKLERGYGAKAIFLGYEDGHVRNSIAHAHFALDLQKQMVELKDVYPDTGKISYSNFVSLVKFHQSFVMVTYDMILYIYMIPIMRVFVPLMIRDSISGK